VLNALEHPGMAVACPRSGTVTGVHADTTALARCNGFVPNSLRTDGVARFVRWYRDH